MKTLFKALVALMLIAGCSSTPYRTSTDFDRQADFAGFRTWTFIDEHPMVVFDGAAGVNPLWERRLMQYIEDELENKGLHRIADPERADFVVGFSIGSRERISVQSYPVAYQGAWGRRWGGAYYGVATETNVRQYTEGQVAIDIFDVDERRPVWHGSATGNVRSSRTQEEREVLARQVVASILADFPPG